MPLGCWYNCGTNHFHQADFCLAEMKKPNVLSNKSSTAWSCAENQIFVGFLRIKSSEQDFKNLYWRISKILLWHIYLKGNIHDWLGRAVTYACLNICVCISIYICMYTDMYVYTCPDVVCVHIHVCVYMQHLYSEDEDAHCNTLHHTATRCNTLQHSAAHCNTRAPCTHKIRVPSATHFTILQHAATRCNTLQHAATHEHLYSGDEAAHLFRISAQCSEISADLSGERGMPWSNLPLSAGCASTWTCYHIYVCICMFIYTSYKHMYMYIYIFIYIYMFIYINMFIYIQGSNLTMSAGCVFSCTCCQVYVCEYIYI